MNYLLLLVLMVSSLAFADSKCSTDRSSADTLDQLVISTDVPAHLRGATIIVRRADGVESSVPAEKFKVVPRKQQFLVTHTMQREVTSCVETAAAQAARKNRISVLGGQGPLGKLDHEVEAGRDTVYTRNGFVGGLQYQREVFGPMSIGIQGQTNKTGSLNLGLDF